MAMNVKNNSPGPRIINLANGGQFMLDPGQSANLDIAEWFQDAPVIKRWVEDGDLEFGADTSDGVPDSSMGAEDRAKKLAEASSNPEGMAANLRSPATAADPGPAIGADAPRPVEDDDQDPATMRRAKAKK